MMDDKWKDIFQGVIIVATSIFLIFAVAGYPMGIVGKFIEGSLKLLFGNGIYVSLAFLILFGYYKLRHFDVGNRLRTWAGIVTMFVASEVVFTLNLPPASRHVLTQLGEGGGVAGYCLTALFLKLFGLVGSIIVLIVMILLSSVALGFPLFSFIIRNRVSSEQRDLPENEPERPHIKKKRKEPKKVIESSKKQAEEVIPVDMGGELPPIKLLPLPAHEDIVDDDWQEEKRKLEDTLLEFGVEARVERVEIGPTVRRYELEPAPGTKMSKVVGLSREIALALAATSVRIEAPIPGKPYVGIEVPNKNRKIVYLREILSSDIFLRSHSKLTVALGKDVGGRAMTIRLEELPHLLIAGSTGSGKSVYINSLIVSILYKAIPEEVKFIMIDPKRVELTLYNGLPHLLAPVITTPKKAVTGFKWAIAEMERRYDMFSGVGVRDIKGYNQYVVNEQEGERLPYIVIIVDELADLMMTSPKEVEALICRLAQMARATGIHIVIATQRPSVNVVTGLIKANIPARIAFTLPSQTDSRTVIDISGAEKLLGRGDMLFVAPYLSKPMRIQSPYVSEKEIHRIMRFFKERYGGTEKSDILSSFIDTSNGATSMEELVESDPLFPKALEILLDNKRISASFLQRRLGIGYNRASRIVDTMESMGLIGAADGAKPRKLIVSEERLKEFIDAKSGRSP